MHLKKTLRLITITMLMIILTSCNSNNSTVNVESFELNGDNEPIEIELGKATSVSYFATPYEIKEDNVACVTENENIAQAVLNTVTGVSGKKVINVQIRSKNIGATNIYIKDSNGNLESEKISISVVETLNDDIDNSDIVYITPTGKKYHLSKTCGGSNSYKSTLNKVNRLRKEPCLKCAQ